MKKLFLVLSIIFGLQFYSCTPVALEDSIEAHATGGEDGDDITDPDKKP